MIPSACCTTSQWKSCRCTTRSASVAGMCTLLSQHESVGKAASVHVQALEPSRVLCKSLLLPESWPSPGTALTADWRPSRHSPKPHGLPAPSTFAFLPACFFFHADHAISCPWNIIRGTLIFEASYCVCRSSSPRGGVRGLSDPCIRFNSKMPSNHSSFRSTDLQISMCGAFSLVPKQ